MPQYPPQKSAPRPVGDVQSSPGDAQRSAQFASPSRTKCPPHATGDAVVIGVASSEIWDFLGLGMGPPYAMTECIYSTRIRQVSPSRRIRGWGWQLLNWCICWAYEVVVLLQTIQITIFAVGPAQIALIRFVLHQYIATHLFNRIPG